MATAHRGFQRPCRGWWCKRRGWKEFKWTRFCQTPRNDYILLHSPFDTLLQISFVDRPLENAWDLVVSTRSFVTAHTLITTNQIETMRLRFVLPTLASPGGIVKVSWHIRPRNPFHHSTNHRWHGRWHYISRWYRRLFCRSGFSLGRPHNTNHFW